MKFKNKLINLSFILITNVILSQNVVLKYTGSSDEEINLEYFQENILVKKSALGLTDRITSFKTNGNTVVFCNDVFRRTLIYAEPNDSILFDVDEKRLIHYYSNTNKYRKTESEYINECFTKYGVNETERSKKITIMVSQGFNLSEYIDSQYVKEQELLENYLKNDKVSKSFYICFKNIFWCLKTHNSIDSNLVNATLEIENSYQRSHELLNLAQYRELLYDFNLKMYNTVNPNPNLSNKLQFIQNKKYLPEIKNFLLYKTMTNYIEENPDITKIDKNAVNIFKKNCKNSKYVKLIDKELQPSIIPLILDEVVKKNKGKLVLIDFWASWCAPCRSEFPAEKKLMEKHPEMVFLFFSIDTKDEDWKRAMGEYPDMLNKDNSFHLTRKSHLELIDKIKLTSIPRYLLFDKEGKLISDVAPRPSSNDIETLIKEYSTNK